MPKELVKPTVTIRKRLIIILALFTLLIISLVVRIAWIQIVNGEDYKKAAYKQQNSDRTIKPARGVISDRNGKELAISASVDTIWVNPLELKSSKISLEGLAENLSQILELKKEDVLKKLSNTGKNQVITYQVLSRKIERNVGDKVRDLITRDKLVGIYIDKDTKRYYPNKNLAAQVLGFVGSDNQGLAGIEYEMDKYLKGIPGKILGEVDAVRRELPSVNENSINSQDGSNVVLTIDETIQYFAEKALQQSIDDFKVLGGGTAIVMDPRNGEILAMVSKPDFDLNTPFSFPVGVSNFDTKNWDKLNSQDKTKKLSETVWRNMAVDNTYEPGSTFKAITSAAGIEEGLVNENTPVVDRVVKVGGWNIDCWKTGGHGNETFRESVYNSCNPVFVKLSQQLGIDTFYKYVKAFGFYDRTGIALPGEALSIMHVKPTETDMATSSFGQSFQITPIQMITAYAAIANGGNLLKPHIIKELTDSNGNIIEKYSPEITRNVISKQTSEELRSILEGVVSEGLGINAYVQGYKVAGKTATSETFDNQGKRSKERYIASFSAFAPADNPVICVLVVLDHPSMYDHHGGVVSGSAAAGIIDETLNYLGIEKKYSDMDKKLLTQDVKVPYIKNKKVGEAKKILLKLGLQTKVIGGGNDDSIILDQIPKSDTSLPYKGVVVLNISKTEDVINVSMPDLLNKTISEATKTLNNLGLNIKVFGGGNAIIQEIPFGEAVPLGKSIKVQFRILNAND